MPNARLVRAQLVQEVVERVVYLLNRVRVVQVVCGQYQLDPLYELLNVYLFLYRIKNKINSFIETINLPLKNYY